MGNIEHNRKIIKALHKLNLNEYKNLRNLLDMCIAIKEDDIKLALDETKIVKKLAASGSRRDVRFVKLYYDSLLFLSPYDFDSYLIYMEKDRKPEKRFYLPRRKVLRVVVEDLQDLEDGVIEFLGVSLPPRVGKSTLCIFFMTWQMGKYPDKANLMSGHSDKLTEGFYTEAVNIITSEEYHWSDVFPNCQVQKTSAKNESININTPTRFPTLTCRSIGGTLTGAVEAANLLYSDDLIEDREESLNPDRLENKYQAYLNQLVDRKLDKCKELMVGTRWNVYDPLGRVADDFYDNPKYRFRVIPALNEDGESNFQYLYGVGFSTEYYENIKNRLDDNEWMAKYQGDPYIREGLLFPKDSLNYFNGTLPGVEPDRIVGVCDVAWGGGDSLSMPFAYIYGGDAYLPDVIFNKGDKDVTKPVIIGRTKKHNPQQEHFEANNGGDEYADDIDRQLRNDGIHINITHKKAPNTSSKLARIIQYAPDIKRFYFLDEKQQSKEYKAFMKELTTFVQTGKNPHDDAADSLAQLAQFLIEGIPEIKVMSRAELGV